MTRYLSVPVYLWLVEQVTGIRASVLASSGRAEIADPVLHAPAASFGGVEFYAALVDKAALLCWRLTRNDPLPDGT